MEVFLMPAVGMIRSTRVFIPKSLLKDSNGFNGIRSDSGEIQSTKSGKWLRLLQNSGETKVDAVAVRGHRGKSDDGYGWDDDQNTLFSEESVEKNSVAAVESVDTRDNLMFGTVYSRKRRRRRRLAKRKFLISDDDDDDDDLQEQFPEDALFGRQYVRRHKRRRSSTLEEVKEQHLVQELDREEVLSIVVESSSSSSVYRFSCFLVSILKFMRRRTSSTIRLSNLALFMCSEPISRVFSLNGIHFSCDSRSKIPDEEDDGFCKILETRYCSIPLFLVNFSAIPRSFLSLHSSISLRSQYSSFSLIRFLEVTTDRVGLSGTNSMVSKRIVSSSNLGANELLSGRLGGLYNLKWKTSSLRSVRVRKPRIMNFNWKCSSLQSVRSSIGHNLIKANGSVEKVNDTVEQKSSTMKNDIKDLKSLLVELRQNIDSVSCTADILVIEDDRCYKEVGAKVMLQRLESKEWTLGIERQGLIRHMYKAQFVMRSCTTNRFTHAMIWNSESGWKLEFSNKQDWVIFKELFKECVERNLWASFAKSIPVPTALEVPGYENSRYVPFVRPDAYITVHEDEVTRALMQVANYDMDSDDEVWLEKLNINLSRDDSGFQLVSAENFGEVIDTFEKIAFNSPDDALDEERTSNLCPEMDLGRDIVRTIYQYWLKKRKRKRSALLRVFQHRPSTKLQPPNEPVLQPQAPRSKPALRPRENKPVFRPREPNKLVVRKRRSSERTSQSDKDKQRNALPGIYSSERTSRSDKDKQRNALPGIYSSERTSRSDKDKQRNALPGIYSSERTSQSDKDKQRNALPAPSVDQKLEDIGRGQQDILSPEEEMRIDQENRQRIKEAIESANRYTETAVSKRKRAQTLMETADLALYWATMAMKIAGAIPATGSSETAVSSLID